MMTVIIIIFLSICDPMVCQITQIFWAVQERQLEVTERHHCRIVCLNSAGTGVPARSG